MPRTTVISELGDSDLGSPDDPSDIEHGGHHGGDCQLLCRSEIQAFDTVSQRSCVSVQDQKITCLACLLGPPIPDDPFVRNKGCSELKITR